MTLENKKLIKDGVFLHKKDDPASDLLKIRLNSVQSVNVVNTYFSTLGLNLASKFSKVPPSKSLPTTDLQANSMVPKPIPPIRLKFNV